MQLNQDRLPEFPPEFEGVPAFIVGGWVRDIFRQGVEPSDVDIMVAGISREEMLDRGFTEIDNAGNETFGVFIDSLGREVAMAREERSTGPGHRDFTVEPIDPSVPADQALLEDLKRRDFTVNAMAVFRDGSLFDPHGGRSDLEQGIIRAVDDNAFIHDPLRILRGARFASRLSASVHPETWELMQGMVDELDSLPGERVRLEMEKALEQSPLPSQFFFMLDSLGALEIVMPEIADLTDVPAGPKEWHQEGSAFEHTMMVLDEMALLRPGDKKALLMALTHDLGKVPQFRERGNFHGHGAAGLPLIDSLNRRLRFSNEMVRAMKEGAEQHMRLKNPSELREATLFDTAMRVRNQERLLDLMQADARGRMPRGEFDPSLLRDAFDRAQQACDAIGGEEMMERGHDPSEDGEKFGKMMRDARISKMKSLR